MKTFKEILIEKEEKYGVYPNGDSINYKPDFIGSKEEATAKAKELNKTVSKNDKERYKAGYKVMTIASYKIIKMKANAKEINESVKVTKTKGIGGSVPPEKSFNLDNKLIISVYEETDDEEYEGVTIELLNETYTFDTKDIKDLFTKVLKDL